MRSPAYLILSMAGLGLSLVLASRLAIKPGPVPFYPRQTLFLKTLALPHGLPVPIAQFYNHLYDQAMTLTESVWWGSLR